MNIPCYFFNLKVSFMIKKLVLCSILALSIQSAFAQDAAPAAASKLADSMHLRGRIEAIKQQSLASSQKQVDQMMAQLGKSTTLTAAQNEALRAATTKFVTSLANAWSSEEAARIYTSYLTSTMPAPTIERSLAFYATPEGQQSLDIVGAAEQKMVAYIAGSSEKATAANYAVFIEDMKRIMSEKAH